jgi:predicted phosphohydrolase
VKKIAWITDPHFNALNDIVFDKFVEENFLPMDMVLISGDIAQGDSLDFYLDRLSRLPVPMIAFVLGNHDYYNSSFEIINNIANRFSRKHKNLIFLDKTDCVELTKSTGLIGHTGWADGLCGKIDYNTPLQIVNDFKYIFDFHGMTKSDQVRLMQKKAKSAARHIKRSLKIAFEKYENVFMLTHFPPFAESSWYEGKLSDDKWLPYVCSKTVGDVVKDFMKNCDGKLTILCGHTHGEGKVSISDNIYVYTGFLHNIIILRSIKYSS